MLHEALFYLWNLPTDLYSTNELGIYRCNIELEDFLHPGEKALLKRIIEIADSYHKIQLFIQKVLFNDSSNSDDFVRLENNVQIHSGLYLKAFCDGVDIVLEEYRREIVNLESVVLKNPQVSLSFVFGCIDKYTLLLNTLNAMINTIKDEKIHGCLILGRFMQYTHGGFVDEACSKIIFTINAVFYKHLCNWLIYGNLDDCYEEFFIQDDKCSDSNFLYPEQMNISEIDSSKYNKKHKFKNPPKIQQFSIRREMLPTHIHEVTAQKILFMGRMVWIMRNDPLHNNNSETHFQRDIWSGKELEYFRKIQNLARHKFNLVEFDGTIEECRLCLSSYLWTVVVKEAHLLEHLQLIREYFALGRGELFQQFIIAAEDQIADTPKDYLVTKLNAIFTETARKMYHISEKYTEGTFIQNHSYKKIELFLPSDFDKDSNVWEQVEINVLVSWPLHMLFHPKSMDLYNKLFRFLLRIKKSHVDLNRLWLFHMEGKRKIDVGVWTLRNNLMVLINNLQYYLQVDVIEAHFSVLKNAISNVNEFENIIKLHARFQTDLLGRTFIVEFNETSESSEEYNIYQIPKIKEDNLAKMVFKTLLFILELCDKFCALTITWDSELTSPQRNELTTLSDQFDLAMDYLLDALYSLREQKIGHHLMQLLNRLDYNRWFSRNKPDFNLSLIEQ